MSLFHELRCVFLLGYFIVLTVAFPAINANAQTSTDIIVESVNDHGPGDQLLNSIANGDGFIQNMVFPGSRWRSGAGYTNSAVYDTDFADSAKAPMASRGFVFLDRLASSFSAKHKPSCDLRLKDL